MTVDSRYCVDILNFSRYLRLNICCWMARRLDTTIRLYFVCRRACINVSFSITIWQNFLHHFKYVVHDSNVNFMLGREHWNINYIHSTQPLACWWPKSKYTESRVTLNTMHNKRLHSIWTMDLLYINKTTCGTAHGIGDKMIWDVSNCRPKLRRTVFRYIYSKCKIKLL